MADRKTIATLGGRLASLIEILKNEGVGNEEGKMNNGIFANSIGIAPPQFSRILKNEFGLTVEQVLRISEKYNVRAGWILEGEEPMKKQKSGPSQEPDLDLLTLMRKQADDLKANFDKLFEPLKEPVAKNTDPEEVFVDLTGGRKKKAGKL